MTEPRWVDCKDEMPEQNETILCVNDKNEMFVATYSRHKANYDPYYFDSWDSGHCCGNEKGDAIYWMKLPKLP